jgi:hypothetical protein
MTRRSSHPGVTVSRRAIRATSAISGGDFRHVLAVLREFFPWVIIVEPG